MTPKSKSMPISVIAVLLASFVASLFAKEIYFRQVIDQNKWHYYHNVLDRKNVEEIKTEFHLSDYDVKDRIITGKISGAEKDYLVLEKINNDSFFWANYRVWLIVILVITFGATSTIGLMLILFIRKMNQN